MATPTRVTLEDLARDLAAKLQISEAEACRFLVEACASMRDSLSGGRTVELGDLISLAVSGRPELREDESGGFSAYAPKIRGLAAEPLGALRDALDRSCLSAIYYVARGEGPFKELLSDHFGRRGWQLVHTHNGLEVLSRLERFPPVALVYESNVEGWREVVRELKCNPGTNWVPIVGIYPRGSESVPASKLTVLPDEIVYEPFPFSDFIQTAGAELAERVTASVHDLIELTAELPGTPANVRNAGVMIEEMLFRAGLSEEFARAARSALHEALDNAARHGHRHVECCTITMRMILDPRRLVLAVRDSGEGFDHAAALSAARGRVGVRTTSTDPLARAAAALRSRRGDVREGGIARMLMLVDRVDYNRAGNEVVLTKLLPSGEADTSTNPNAGAKRAVS
ncbi:MAG: ATP-binding protein [Planctomycetota bacterium]|jgi:anti-sigma regulatory factor (Ser/Thr protein kinase)